MTDESAEPGGGRDQLREEAATWFARMRGENADLHREAFEAWLARGAVHRAAYNRIGEIFAAGKVLKTQSGDRPGRDSPRGRRLAIVAVATGACAALAIPLVVAPDGWKRTSGPPFASRVLHPDQRMTTDRIRRFPLADGASVVLDTDSLLVARVGGAPAVYRLVRGRGRFDVPDRPGAQPTILAGPGVVTSAGGAFDLWLRSDGSLDAQSLSGRIGLRRAMSNGFAGGPAAPIGVLPGRHYRMTSVGRTTILADALGRDWPRGILEFRSTPLEDVVEEANRYSAIKIVLGDPGLGKVRVSGRFRIDEPLRLAERLATLLTLQLDRSSPGMIVLHHAKETSNLP